MTIPISPHGQSWNGRDLKITAVTPEERKRIVGQKISARAYELSELRGFKPGHSHEDWQLAQIEIVAPLNCGYLLFDRGIELHSDAACFGEGMIEIYAEPRRLTFLGRSRSCEADGELDLAGRERSARSIVRSVNLPYEIEPSKASARFNGRMMVICLPRACQKLAASAAA